MIVDLLNWLSFSDGIWRTLDLVDGVISNHSVSLMASCAFASLHMNICWKTLVVNGWMDGWVVFMFCKIFCVVCYNCIGML